MGEKEGNGKGTMWRGDAVALEVVRRRLDLEYRSAPKATMRMKGRDKEDMDARDWCDTFQVAKEANSNERSCPSLNTQDPNLRLTHLP